MIARDVDRVDRPHRRAPARARPAARAPGARASAPPRRRRLGGIGEQARPASCRRARGSSAPERLGEIGFGLRPWRSADPARAPRRLPPRWTRPSLRRMPAISAWRIATAGTQRAFRWRCASASSLSSRKAAAAGSRRSAPGSNGDARLVDVGVAAAVVDRAEHRVGLVDVHEGAGAVVDGLAGDRAVVGVHDAVDEAHQHPLAPPGRPGARSPDRTARDRVLPSSRASG